MPRSTQGITARKIQCLLFYDSIKVLFSCLKYGKWQNKNPHSIFRSVLSCPVFKIIIEMRENERKSNNNNKRKMIEIRQREMRLHFNSHQLTCVARVHVFFFFWCAFSSSSHKNISTRICVNAGKKRNFSYQSLFAYVRPLLHLMRKKEFFLASRLDAVIMIRLCWNNKNNTGNLSITSFSVFMTFLLPYEHV